MSIQFASEAPAAAAPKKSKSEKPVNVMTKAEDIIDVATVEQQIEAIAVDIELTEKVAVARIGDRLREAKELFAYDRREGGFQGWVRSRLNRSEEWARQAIIIHQAIASGNFQPQLELLSQKAQFEAATAEPDVKTIIAERVAAGEVFTAAQVKEIKAKAAEEAIAQINSDAEQARAELAELRKAADERDLKSASDMRERDQRIDALEAKLTGYEDQVAKFQKSLPKPNKAKEQAAENGGVVLGSDGKYHSGSSVEQKRMHEAFMFAFDKALDLTENPPSPERVVAGCPESDRERLAELCMGAADYFIKIRASLNGK